MDIKIKKGITYTAKFRMAQGNAFGFANISAISQAAPAVITATDHNMPDQWPFLVEGVKGMDQINSESSCGCGYVGTVIDDDHISVNGLNSMGFFPYKSGGAIKFNLPWDITGYEPDIKFGDSDFVFSGVFVAVDEESYSITIEVEPDAVIPARTTYEITVTAPSGEVYEVSSGQWVVQ